MLLPYAYTERKKSGRHLLGAVARLAVEVVPVPLVLHFHGFDEGLDGAKGAEQALRVVQHKARREAHLHPGTGRRPAPQLLPARLCGADPATTLEFATCMQSIPPRSGPPLFLNFKFGKGSRVVPI